MRTPLRPRFIAPPYQDAEESGRIILRDGSTAQVRLSRPTDRDALTRFFAALSADSRYRRFLTASMPGPELIARLAGEGDTKSALTLIVTRIESGAQQIIATGSYLAREARTAEVAFAVADAYQGKGLGTILLERLALLAVRNGFTRFWALTTADNLPMLDLFRASGFEMQEQPDGRDVVVHLGVAATEESVARLETRDRVATVASLLPFFRPNGVAVVGASRSPTSIGYRVLDAIVQARFNGLVHPVNPRAEEIAGLKCYPSVRDIPTQIDLAVIVVPARLVAGVVDDCAARGVRALVVVSAGFAEVGEEGIALQKALVEKVRGHGMRLVGPNCLGILDADPAVRLNASFSPIFPPSGRIAMSSQSGAVGLAAVAAASRYGLGFSTFVSVGNKADVSGNDLLQYWEEDPATDVILLYLESFGNPRRFARIARRVSRRKPVVVLQSGLTGAGSRAAGSHTAALATNATAVEALFRQTGVIRASSLEEMFDLALVLGSQPLPRGGRVGIVTNSGGPAILATDAGEAGGLTIPEPSPELKARLKEKLSSSASTRNPIDLIAGAGSDEYRHAVETLLTSGEYDAMMVIYTPVGLADTDAVKNAIAEGVMAARKNGSTRRPVLACFLNQEEHRTHLVCGEERIPCYPFPEMPASVLGKVARYAAWLDQPPDVIPDYEDMDFGAIRGICQKTLARGGSSWLSAEDTLAVLEAARLPLVPARFARTTDEAIEAAREIGFPVAVKLASRTLVHKTEVGGVRLGMQDAAAVGEAVEQVRSRLRALGSLEAMDGVVVQKMLSGGVEVMAGMTHDPLFGPLVAFGLGGIFVEVLADVAFRVAPLSNRDAAEMVKGIKGLRLLQGYRGRHPADLEAIEELLLRTSRLAEEVPEINEIDFNPIFALPTGCLVADARIRVKNSQ
jgi:acetyl coenzyme A synthetase (ADP forming)-like protein